MENTVNGYQARITESAINWTQGIMDLHINRRTGQLIVTYAQSNMQYGECLKANEKKFWLCCPFLIGITLEMQIFLY